MGALLIFSVLFPLLVSQTRKDDGGLALGFHLKSAWLLFLLFYGAAHIWIGY